LGLGSQFVLFLLHRRAKVQVVAAFLPSIHVPALSSDASVRSEDNIVAALRCF
jgi:hypothetical protein